MAGSKFSTARVTQGLVYLSNLPRVKIWIPIFEPHENEHDRNSSRPPKKKKHKLSRPPPLRPPAQVVHPSQNLLRYTRSGRRTAELEILCLTLWLAGTSQFKSQKTIPPSGGEGFQTLCPFLQSQKQHISLVAHGNPAGPLPQFHSLGIPIQSSRHLPVDPLFWCGETLGQTTTRFF